MYNSAVSSSGVDASPRSKALLVLGLTLIVVTVAASLLRIWHSPLVGVFTVGVGCTVYGGGALIRTHRARSLIQLLGAVISCLGVLVWLSGL